MLERKKKDAELNECIRKIGIGDKEALKVLYDNYRESVFLFALSIVKNYHLAEEVLQDVFVNIMQYSSNSKVKNAKNWIFTITRNQCIKVMKNENGGNIQSINICEETLFAHDDTENVGNAVEDIESLKQLNELERQIVILYIYGKLKQTEIAEVMDLPYLKVRSKYNYAIKKLKKYYINRGGFDD